MDQTLIARYAPGGDLYDQYQASYGKAGADAIYAAAQTGEKTAVTDAIVKQKYGNDLQTSTAIIFGEQVATDPLAAPLAAADTFTTNTLKSLFSSWTVWVVVIIAGVALFLYMGGSSRVKGVLAK